jgi:hypothetical protein
MLFCKTSHLSGPFGRRQGSKQLALSFVLLLLVFCIWLGDRPAFARSGSAPVLEAGYVAALSAADRFLQAWQSGDVENGIALLASHAKEKITAERLDNFFSPPLSAYEIGRGKLLKRRRYEFPVVLMQTGAKNTHPRRRFSSIIVLQSGGNDWAVDKLP